MKVAELIMALRSVSPDAHVVGCDGSPVARLVEDYQSNTVTIVTENHIKALMSEKLGAPLDNEICRKPLMTTVYINRRTLQALPSPDTDLPDPIDSGKWVITSETTANGGSVLILFVGVVGEGRVV